MMSFKNVERTLFSVIILLLTSLSMSAGIIKGTIKDKHSKDPLIGATVQITNSTFGAIADIDGKFEFPNLKNGIYSLEIKYISYKTIKLSDIKIDNKNNVDLVIDMEPEDLTLGDVTVVAQVKKNTDLALLTSTKNSLLVQSGVSAQQISKTQDKDASEVIRRVPGISIIDDKFVMVRGLSQRYNNVWINNSAVPSSEADSRAFSFDIIPSSQLDNMVIVKSPAPEYPADFTGGFIIINTKDMPSENALSVSLGGTINDQTHFRDFLYNKGSQTDFLGFDNGLRSLQGGINKGMKTFDGRAVDLMNNGLNNDWTVKKMKPVADLSLNIAYNHKWNAESGRQYGLLATLNYGNSYKTFTDMENSLFGSYDQQHDQSNYLRRSKDNQYNHNVRAGAMLNLTFIPVKNNHRFEFKNIFNQLGKERYTSRKGISAQSDLEESAEYYYSSRTTYNGQFTGKHTFDKDKFDWNAGYAYANRNLPDRRRYLRNDAAIPNKPGLGNGNDISREFTKLDEHILSVNVNYLHDFTFGNFTPSLKAGAYSEYRTRTYNTRLFYYNWNQGSNNLPIDFQYLDIPGELMTSENYGIDKLHLLEEANRTNNYNGNNLLAAGYAGVTLPVGKLNIYAGVRFESNNMELVSNLRDDEISLKSTHYKNNDLFPSVNATYKFNEKHQLRFAYGKSVNRPEFREVSTSVYYDFDLASPVQGNPLLKPAYIQNLDLRYEFYPSAGEVVSVALFYKNFDNPIEWTYTVSGGTDLTYSYANAKSANNFGIELDIRKNLDFIGMRDFSWTFNGALIKSNVNFAKGRLEEDRPMQGQSPYLINTGLFYTNPKINLNVGVLYNRIGKRIIGVGRSVGTTGGDDTNNIPNSYEMPRNAIDISLSKKFGKHWELKASVRDLLAERVYFKQFVKVTKDGSASQCEQVTKSYKPGRSFGLTISYNL